RLIGFIVDGNGKRMVRNDDVLGTIDDVERLVATQRIDRIVVGLSDRRGRLPIRPLLRAKLSGVRVEDATTTYERVTGKILIDDLRPSWLIFSDGFRVSRLTRLMKRAIDLTLALAMTVAALPVVAMTALLVLIDDGAPVLSRQERVGENGRTFVLSKFRSMRKDAEKGGQPIWATDGDDRVTRIGGFLRKTRLDELPQLWNVIRGDMSFVGP